MASLTGNPKMDALLVKHEEEIRRLETLAEAKAKENQELIAKFYASRAKRLGAASER